MPPFFIRSTIFNLFFRKAMVADIQVDPADLEPTPFPGSLPKPPIMPERADWQQLVLESRYR